MTETLSKIQVEVEAEALIDALAYTLEEFNAESFWQIVADVGDEALVNTMHYSLAKM